MDTSLSYLGLYIICGAISAVSLFDPKNKWCGVKCRYTYADPDIWAKANKFGGTFILFLSVIFVCAHFLVPEEKTRLILMLLFCGSLIVAGIASVLYARKLYYQKGGAEIPERNINPNETEGVLPKVALNKHVKQLIIFTATIFIALNAFIYLAYFLPLGGQPIPSHFNADGVADDWMNPSAFFGIMLGVQVFMAGVALIIHYSFKFSFPLTVGNMPEFCKGVLGTATLLFCISAIFLGCGSNLSAVATLEAESSVLIFSIGSLLCFGLSGLAFLLTVGAYLYLSFCMSKIAHLRNRQTKA